MASTDHVIQVDIESLSEEQIEEFQQAFAMFDKVRGLEGCVRSPRAPGV